MRQNRFALAMLCLVVSLKAGAALRYPGPNEKWVKLAAGEFYIFSNASERETLRVTRDLARMREGIGKVTKLNVRGSLPVNVFLFRDQRALQQYVDVLMQQSNANVAGLFLPARDAMYVLLSASDSRDNHLVYHELTHYFINNSSADVPVWFNEGLAEFYSTFAAKGDHIEVGAPLPEHLALLRNGATLPLQRLFTIDVRSAEYHERNRQGLFYAQSWAFVHWVMTGDTARRKQLINFFDLTAAGKDFEQAFQSAFKMTLAEGEQALRQYVRKPTMQYISYTLAEVQVPEVENPVRATPAEVLVALGSLLSHANANTLGDADAYLREAIRIDPQNADAYAGLGYVRTQLRRATEATEAYEKAIGLGTKDASTYVAYGASIVERLAGRSGGGSASKTDIARARDLFAKAIELDASNARAYAGMGTTYLVANEEPAAGITALEMSLRLAPAQDDVAFSLAQLYARAGRRADAQRVAENLRARSSNEELRSQLNNIIALADIRRAEELLRASNFADVVPLLDSILKTATDDRMKQYAESLRAEAISGQQIGMVNRAIDLANKRKITEALKILDELLPQIANAEMKTRVSELRDDLGKRRK